MNKYSLIDKIIVLFFVVIMVGCAHEVVVVVDDTPAQFLKATNDGRQWEVYFDKQPKDLSVEGAKEYFLTGITLSITAESCKRDVVVEWQGGKKEFSYKCPEDDDWQDPNRSYADEGPPPATMVTVDPAPGGTAIPSNTQFSLTFDKGVTAATVNGTPATGFGANWTAAPVLSEGATILHVGWTNRDGSTGSQAVGPYTVRDK